MAKKLTFTADFPYSVDALFAQATREDCLLSKQVHSPTTTRRSRV